jgi:hypothetical protein
MERDDDIQTIDTSHSNSISEDEKNQFEVSPSGLCLYKLMYLRNLFR